MSSDEKNVDLRNLYSVFDRKAVAHSAPFLAENDEMAIRQLLSTIRNPQMRETSLLQFPEDFSLVRLGSFDVRSGCVSGLDGDGALPELIIQASSVVVIASGTPAK